MLCRLNHELLPEPGNPIARTTGPLVGRAGAACSTCTGTASGAATGATGGGSAAPASGVSGSAGPAVSGVVRGGASVGERRAPLRPPRLRRRRVGRLLASPDGVTTAGSDSSPE